MLETMLALCKAGESFERRGWMLATAGNLSVRDAKDPEYYFVSASGVQKGDLHPTQDFVRVGLGMQVPVDAPKVSAETIVHDKLYALRPDIVSVQHVHAPKMTLISRAIGAQNPWHIHGLEYIKALGFWDEGDVVHVPVVANYHAIPQLADAVVAAAQQDTRVPCVLVEGHGVYAWGSSVAAARRHLEAIEFLAGICWEERFRR